jgi:hypothetical protein
MTNFFTLCPEHGRVDFTECDVVVAIDMAERIPSNYYFTCMKDRERHGVSIIASHYIQDLLISAGVEVTLYDSRLLAQDIINKNRISASTELLDDDDLIDLALASPETIWMAAKEELQIN